MRRAYTSWLLVLGLASLASAATPSGAQQPVTVQRDAHGLAPATAPPGRSVLIDKARVAELDSLLPILDDAGQVITEAEIAAATRRRLGLRTTMTFVGMVVGAGLFAAVLPQPEGNADCSPYDPCTPREEFYVDNGAVAGALLGALVFNLGPEYGRDRYRAVEYIRARRRAAPAVR